MVDINEVERIHGSNYQEEEQEMKRINDKEATEVEEEDEAIKRVPPWRKQITVRGVIVSIVIGAMYTVVVMKLNLTTGIVPNLNVSPALLAFIIIRSWTKLLRKVGIPFVPFTKQENSTIQTAAVACYTIASVGGFGTYLLALTRKTYEVVGIDTPGNTPATVKEPGILWMISYLLVASFVGLFALVPLRKIMIIDYKLTYPSGTATAVLINGLHTLKGDKNASKQVREFTKFFSISFLWACFQWFYSGGEQCGFAHFPTLGLAAMQNSFYFDFSPTFIGAGMICSHIVNFSLLLGGILSWGIMWPLIRGLRGEWFPANLPESSMQSVNGYKVFLCIALLLGDGLYNFVKVLCIIARNMHTGVNKNDSRTGLDKHNQAIDDLSRNKVFIGESIPMWVACVGYMSFSVIAIIVIPLIFPQIKWYYVLVAFIFAPPLCFCNAYGAGLTDINTATNYGNIAVFIFAALAGKDNGVIAGLVGCGLVKSVVSIAADLMHDFKAGHLTLTSPRSMLISQAIGTAIGCVIAPVTFLLFYNAFDIENPKGEYKAPHGLVYRNMAIIGVQGFSALPNHCLQLCYGFFAFAIAANIFRDMVPKRIGKWVPLPMAMAVPFFVGTYFAIDMCVGSLIVLAWQKLNHQNAILMVPTVASGLICGDGLWILPSSVLSLAKIRPPICMKFFSAE